MCRVSDCVSWLRTYMQIRTFTNTTKGTTNGTKGRIWKQVLYQIHVIYIFPLLVRSITFLYLEILHSHYTGDVSTYLNIAKYD